MPLPYVTLMASLPFLPPPGSAPDLPISRLRLEGRLAMLSEEDARVLDQVQGVLSWARIPMERFDHAVAERATRVLEGLASPTLRTLVTERLEMRTAMAGLRRRFRGDPPPAPRDPWGFGRWTGLMRRHWTEPTFRLEGHLPWLRRAYELVTADETVALERHLMETVWRHLGRLGEAHQFDLEAVVIYVLRWDVLDRWTRHDGEAATARFQALVEAGMAGVPA